MTMKPTKLLHIVLFMLGALGPAAALSCGGVAGEVGTETGNPPVLDKLRLRLEVRDSGVTVIGEAGAVSPGGARVTVRNLTSGEARTVTAAADGSFSARLRGGLEDGYEVTVSSRGEDTTEGVPSDMGSGMSSCDAGPVLLQRCGTSACHGSGSPFSAFAADEMSAASFVDIESAGPCVDEGRIIDSANPEDSLILTKLGPNPPCGSQMPLTAPGQLSVEEVACIASWLDSFRR
jgi:hypothetical protein